jgi:hypothetical protein
MEIGTCKSRRSADVPAQLVPIDHNTHVIGGFTFNGAEAAASAAAALSNIKEPSLASLYGSTP